jgi:hypothetical protein
MTPHAHMRSLPPRVGLASLEAARREAMTPHAHRRLLPPGPVRGRFAAQGGLASLEAALREAV